MGEEKKEAMATSNVKAKQELLAKAEISLLLDTYDDIFSDFDPRPYSQRALSDDFLLEAKRATRDKKGALELRFILPHHIRRADYESLIRRRLKEHFKKHADEMEREARKLRRESLILVFVGVVLLIMATLIAHRASEKLLYTFLFVLLEPVGWFTVWTGLEQFYHSVKERKPDLIFYQKMSKADIVFISY